MWVTELVVHRDHRSKGRASTHVRCLVMECNPTIVGIASSHPHAILALKQSSRSRVDGDFIKSHLTQIISLCNIPYLTGKRIVGTLFREISHSDEDEHLVAQIDTEIHINHVERLEAVSKLPTRTRICSRVSRWGQQINLNEHMHSHSLDD